MTNPLIDRVRALGARGAALVAGLSEFQQRIWVVSIVHDAYTDTFIVNEGSFEEPSRGHGALPGGPAGVWRAASSPDAGEV